MAAFGISDGATPLPAQTPYIDLTGMGDRSNKSWVAKLPGGTFRRINVSIHDYDATKLGEDKTAAEDRATATTAKAGQFTAAAAKYQDVLDLTTVGESVEL